MDWLLRLIVLSLLPLLSYGQKMHTITGSVLLTDTKEIGLPVLVSSNLEHQDMILYHGQDFQLNVKEGASIEITVTATGYESYVFSWTAVNNDMDLGEIMLEFCHR